ncbi:reverse transcriptase domain-containing protein [Pseudocnuella soli]|uniref:reverse transcriptase domain-containing protein n=1 Tax=Pseudocnuella soli TaxID=2502779 RepID=UPI00104B1849|nr:reverse transcriptase domain-containing protein [Pseudocnuella soli]
MNLPEAAYHFFEMSLFAKDDKSLLEAFYSAKNYIDLADVFEITPKQFKFHVFMVPGDKKYVQFTLQKKSGGVRNIYAPNGNLKFIQNKLSYILYKIYKPTFSAKGFVLNESIVSNARLHSGKKAILNIDIKDFFESINFGRVYGLFKSKPFSFNTEIAAELANICCFDNKLPQGAPTSPIVTNMICVGLDKNLQSLAKKYNLIYSRYADDITFSTDFKFLPQAIALGKLNVVEVGETVKSILIKHGFKINDKKSRIYYHFNRQVVTGLIVNKQVNVSRNYIRNLRGIIHSIEKFGLPAAEIEFQRKYDKQRLPGKSVPPFTFYLKGKLSFLAQVKGTESSVYISIVKKLRSLIPGEFEKTLTKLEELRKDFDDLNKLVYKGASITARQRGFEFEKFLAELFSFFKIDVTESFKRVGDEQIDAAINFDSWHYLIECKWKSTQCDTRDVDSLTMKLSRSGSQTGGLFISINGWSANVVENLSRNPIKNTILINGDDIKDILVEKVALDQLLKFKLQRLNLYSEPYARWE